MGLFNWGSGGSAGGAATELESIFPMAIGKDSFVMADVISIYSKILTDTLERTQGLADEEMALMWDNCLKSESNEGLVTRLAKAMANKQDLCLVFDRAVNVIRLATGEEATKIKADYTKGAGSKLGVYVSFTHYIRTDLVKIYSALEYCNVSSLNKSMNLSNAVQLKFSELRSSVSLADSADAKTQGQAIAQQLARGKDVMIDAKDSIETAKVDLTASQTAIEFIASKLSFYLGLPAAYITGTQTTGMGTTGENDTKAVERGLKNYFYSIIKPTLDALFGKKVTYKSQDFRQIATGLELLKTFTITDDELISMKNRVKIVNEVFGLPEDAVGDTPKAAEPQPEPKPITQPKDNKNGQN